LELDDKADLALLVHHPLFKTNCKSVHLLKQIGVIRPAAKGVDKEAKKD
jgi:hypothetical protein